MAFSALKPSPRYDLADGLVGLGGIHGLIDLFGVDGFIYLIGLVDLQDLANLVGLNGLVDLFGLDCLVDCGFIEVDLNGGEGGEEDEDDGRAFGDAPWQSEEEADYADYLMDLAKRDD